MRRTAFILTPTLIALFASLDFNLPGYINVQIWYSFCVLVAGFTRSVLLLWGTTFIGIVLAYSALAFGPPLPDGLLGMLYINRSFVVLVLLPAHLPAKGESG